MQLNIILFRFEENFVTETHLKHFNRWAGSFRNLQNKVFRKMEQIEETNLWEIVFIVIWLKRVGDRSGEPN